MSNYNFFGFIIFCWAPIVLNLLSSGWIKSNAYWSRKHSITLYLYCSQIYIPSTLCIFTKSYKKLLHFNIDQTTIYKFTISFLDSLTGNYSRVKKALDNPRLFESLMMNPDVAAGNNPLSLTTLDPEVIKFARDPILLLVLLRTDYSLMNKLMK